MNACPHFAWLCLQWRTLDTEILLMFEKHKQNNEMNLNLEIWENLESVRIEKYETSYLRIESRKPTSVGLVR